MNGITDIFARHVYGPARPYGPGRPYFYESPEHKAGFIATHYRAFRRRGVPATAAARKALALPPVYLPGYSDGYGTGKGLAGAPFMAGRTRLRWIESTAAAGFRFIGWADDLNRSIRHHGWYADAMQSRTLRGGVWALPSKGGRVRLVPGYAEFEGREEMNAGSAALALWDMETGPEADRDDYARDAASVADGIAESVAEDEREFSEALDAGAAAARLILEAEELRRPALSALADARAVQGPPDLRGRIMARAETIAAESREELGKARDKRAEAWGDAPARLESAFREGYANEAGRDGWNRFARGLRLSRFAGEAGDGTLEAEAGA